MAGRPTKLNLNGMKKFTFRHPYFKLNNLLFTTIRGKSRFNDYKIGDVIAILREDHEGKEYVYCYAKLWKKELKRICDIPPTLITLDGSYPGNIIRTYDQFVDLLNSFRLPTWTQATVCSEVSVFYLKQVNEPNLEIGV